MVVQFEKCELNIDQIQKEEFHEEYFAKHEIKVIELIRNWLNKVPHFEFQTSGSTGNAKTILIDTKKIAYSCQATMNKLDPDKKFKTSLLCINPEMIGGAMVVFRALIWGMDLKVIVPTSNPFEYLGANQTYDLTSMVPLQLSHGHTLLDQFNTILVGGARFDTKLTTKANVYSTFGMTETVSHFALRMNGQDYFECTGDTQIIKQEDNRLKIIGSITDHKALITNDLIEFISSTKFQWIGRKDLVINSGGIKINPESVESSLEIPERRNYIVTHLNDPILGCKVVLVIEGEPLIDPINFTHLPKYHIPKEVHYLEKFVFTSSHKIDRLKTTELLMR